VWRFFQGGLPFCCGGGELSRRSRPSLRATGEPSVGFSSVPPINFWGRPRPDLVTGHRKLHLVSFSFLSPFLPSVLSCPLVCTLFPLSSISPEVGGLRCELPLAASFSFTRVTTSKARVTQLSCYFFSSLGSVCLFPSFSLSPGSTYARRPKGPRFLNDLTDRPIFLPLFGSGIPSPPNLFLFSLHGVCHSFLRRLLRFMSFGDGSS